MKLKTFLLTITAAVLAGCGQQTNYLEISKVLDEMPAAASLAKVVYKDGDSYNYACTAASIGDGLFLTSSACTGRNNWIYALDKTRHQAEVVKKGISYSSASDVINDHEANWAILYAPGLRLPPLPLSDWGMTVAGEYCVAYFENEWFWSRSFVSQPIRPIKVCGQPKHRNGLHRPIFWDGKFQKQNGFWGAPVLNDKNEIVGIISYKYTDDFQRSGVLEQQSFAESVKEITAR